MRIIALPAPFVSEMRNIDLVYFNAGGGHRAAALALRAAIQERGEPWNVRLVNLTEILDSKGIFRRMTGFHPEDFYNLRLRRGWTLGLAQELKLLHGLIRLAHGPMSRQLRRHWKQTQPDMVVSLIPNFNRVMCESLAASQPEAAYVTVLTDLADYPPAFWIERNQNQHFVCGTPRAVSQARAAGHPTSHIHATSGMLINPCFYRAPPLDRELERSRHGLNPRQPTGLVMFGGYGSRLMRNIACQLPDTQLILLCGHNQALADRLRAAPAAAPRLVVEFTSDVAYYMQISDFFIGKPGPGSLSEALQLGLPPIVVRDAWTLPQERYNTEWIRDHGVGIVLPSFRHIRKDVLDLIARHAEFRANIRRQQNRAIFEIPVVLGKILESAERRSAPATYPVNVQLDGRLMDTHSAY